MIEVGVDEKCCCCCISLALGYLLLHDSAGGTVLAEYSRAGRPAAIDDAVKSAQPDAFLLRQIENYQKNISPKIKETLGKDRLCKFEPSCSEYSKQAIEKYGSMKGALISINRLLRCNPISKGGADPLK